MSGAVRNKLHILQPFAWVALPLLQVISLCYFGRPAESIEWLVLLSFIAITVLSSNRLFADPKPYSLNKIWWLFNAVFLGFIPSIQAAVHHTPWHEHDVSQATMLKANLIILGCMGVYLIAHFFFSRKISVRRLQGDFNSSGYTSRFMIVAPVLLLLSGAALLYAYGLQGLFLRGYQEAQALQYNSTFQLFFDKGIRGLILYISLVTILLYRQGRLSFMFTISILLCAFLLNFPLAIPRYLAFTFYLSWLLAISWNWVRSGKAFIISILTILLLIGPLVSVTRYAGIDMGKRLHHPIAIFKHAYLTSDYDAYSSLCRTIYFVDTAGSTRGKQLAGVALFFVPRKVWPSKPIGSGAHLFTKLNYDFKNVSCTYLAEGYINFGIGGSIAFALILSFLIAIYDTAFWQFKREYSFHYLHIFYLVLMGMLMFLLRGDLLSSFAYTCGLFISGLVLHLLLKTGIDNKR